MKNLVSKHYVLNIIIGLIFIAFFIAGYFMDMLDEWVNYIAAILIFIASAMRFVKDYKSYTNDRVLLILVLEFIIASVLAVLLALGEFNVRLGVALGAVLYMRGFVYFLIMQLLDQKHGFGKFIWFMVLLTLGAYIWFGGMPFLNELALIALIIGLLIGAFYIFVGINQATHKHEKTK